MNQPRGRPFQPGNQFGRGRPKGSRNKTTMVAQKLLEDHSESIVRKCIVEALKGDRYAQRICMERIIPASRDSCIRIKLPRTITARDVDHAAEQVVQSVAAGRIRPRQARYLCRFSITDGKPSRLVSCKSVSRSWKRAPRPRITREEHRIDTGERHVSESRPCGRRGPQLMTSVVSPN